MEKDSGDGSDAASKQQSTGLLDAANLFGAYWGRDGSSNSAAAAQAQAALFGFGSRYPPPTTLGVAANQAAQLGLHPAASAAWWSMASHLAAQDYLARIQGIQASGMNFPPMGDPYSALSALSGVGMKQPSKSSKSGKSDNRGRPSSMSTSTSSKDKSPSVSSASSQNMRSSYNFPKTSSPSTHHSQSSLSSLASLNNLVSSSHHQKSSKHQQPSQSSRKPQSSSSKSNQDRNMLLRGDLMLAQAAAQGAYHAAVAAATKGKNISSLYPFGMAGTDKDRHGIDSLTGLPHNILSAALEGGDPASVLGGVRLPPDTEIIKYSSALGGPKGTPGSTNRGRKKTISLDPPQNDRAAVPSKRQKVDEYGTSRSSVEVIRLPNRSSQGQETPSFSDYAGISRELLQTIASQSGVSLAALEKQLAGASNVNTDSGMNLSTKMSNESPIDLGLRSGKDDDAPLNLSLKPTPATNQASDALSRLTSLSSSLTVLSADRSLDSRRKASQKPRRVEGSEPRPRSSGSEDSESVAWSRESRPRNLGRGVSKPKKNTVASLLAQSRAMGLRPTLNSDADLEKLKVLLGETASTDSEYLSDSPSDSDASESGRKNIDTHTRLPLALGWRRSTLIRGLSRSCNVKGDVTYTPPEPHSNTKIRSMQELQNFLDSNPSPPLSCDNFNFNSRLILGDYVQLSPDGSEPYTMNETEITKRLEDARVLYQISSRSVPPLDRRMEMARMQQAMRDHKRDSRSKEHQNRSHKEDRSDKTDVYKKDKDIRSQHILESKKKKNEDNDQVRLEEHIKKQQERELRRQQNILLKEQERDRRRQHSTFIRQLDARKRWEERERRKHQNLLDRLIAKEKKLQLRRKEMDILAELRRPQEDSELSQQKPLPTLNRIPGLKLAGEAMASLLQVIEFLHNFGRTLGFDTEALPTLNTLQSALLNDGSTDAENDLLQMLTQLLVCAIEDPGIPHPGRHTTLLNQAIRMGDITNDNISEILRIYLYANATGEVKALTGLSVERERERRIADHHQTDTEMQQASTNTKNSAYYEALHSNSTYKLSESLRDKSFLSLNPTAKGKILAYMCDELLQNKAVLRQIDSSLDNLNVLKKERYLMDMKMRKARAVYQRKVRAEQTEKQQAIALERMHKLVEENSLSNTHNGNSEDQPEKELDRESPHSLTINEKETAIGEPAPSPDSNEELKKGLNKSLNEDMDCDGNISDMESEVANDEDEDRYVTSDELCRKLEKLTKQSDQQMLQLTSASHALRATCYGQDRFWRRYWSLGKCGGVFVEGLESAQPEILQYMADVESRIHGKTEIQENGPDIKPKDETLEKEMELKNIKSELNLSDHTQIIKYEPNVKHSACKTDGSIKMEEKFIQQQQCKKEEDMFDIEDSIPTAFLVQKPTLPVYAEKQEQDSPKVEKDDLVNNLEELRKMAEAVSSQLDAAKKAEEEILEEKAIKEEEEKIAKNEDLESALATIRGKIAEGKWFSILRHEDSSLNNTGEVKEKEYIDNKNTCSEVVLTQGHKWDVMNNLYYLDDPSLFTLNSMVTAMVLPANNFYADSCLTFSGLSQELLDSKDKELKNPETKPQIKEAKQELSQRAKANNLASLGVLNYNALSTYVTCDSPPPIVMAEDEVTQVDKCKVDGLPCKVELGYVAKADRHGWWRISDSDQLASVMESLHPRGVRERELHTSFTQHVPLIQNKLYIDPGDVQMTELQITSQDRLISENGGFAEPDQPSEYNEETARRLDLKILNMVEALEERVAAASMQTKGWRVTQLNHTELLTQNIVIEARRKLQDLELHIERRYLKPPFVLRYASTTEASIGAMLQGDGNNSTPSPQSNDTGDIKGISRGLSLWREALSRCNTSAQLAMLLQALEANVAWDKSIMKANCQFCLSGDNEDQLLLCDGCDKGYHTYCFRPRMDKIPEGDWYCYECINSFRGSRVCIVCGGGGRTVGCALCSKAYHSECHQPHLPKNPRSKWYCANCISKAPPKKPRNIKKKENKNRDVSADSELSTGPSPAPSPASTSTTTEDINDHNEEKEKEQNGLHRITASETEEEPSPEKKRPLPSGNGTMDNHDEHHIDGEEIQDGGTQVVNKQKKEKNTAKKHEKEMAACKRLLSVLESHEDAWPFLLPVNNKQFPQYKKVIKNPMDLSTIKKKLNDNVYKTKEDFATDLRLIFSNCEIFNEDDSPVGRAGHNMRQFFEDKYRSCSNESSH